MKSEKTIVVKLGGSTLGSHDTALEDIVRLQQQGWRIIVVHGGGKLISDWLNRQNLPTRFVRGERVTDRPALDVVVSVLAGLVNKELVARINSLGGKAIGISGVDGGLIQASIKDSELGYVGEVQKVDPAPLLALLDNGYIPVVAPVSSRHSASEAADALVLNVNADIVAGEIAAAVGAGSLMFLTDVAGICDRSGAVIPKLSPEEAEKLITSQVISGGMVPKTKACLRAISAQAATCIVDGRQSHALLDEVTGKKMGTVIERASPVE